MDPCSSGQMHNVSDTTLALSDMPGHAKDSEVSVHKPQTFTVTRIERLYSSIVQF